MSAHTKAIGYHNSGPGSVTFWYQSWHGYTAPFFEGSFNLVGINGNTYPSTTVPFTLTSSTKPPLLVDGVNNFYACKRLPNSFCPTDEDNVQPALKWQGVTMNNLQAGYYRFTYIPIANPSMDWNPATEGVRTNTFFLDAATLNPKVGTNKDFVNNTGGSVNGFEWLVQGSYPTVVSHYDGPYPGNPSSVFSTFTINAVGSNTLFRWTNPGAPIAAGQTAHLGITVTGTTLHTLGTAWTFNGLFAGCVRQVSIGNGFSHLIGHGTVSFENTSTDPPNCPSTGLYIGDLSIEWLLAEVPLADLNTGAVRNPIRTDFVPGIHAIAPGQELPLTIPIAPAAARFAMIKVSIAASSSLTGASIDYIQIELPTAAAQLQLHGANTLFDYATDLIDICSPDISPAELVYRGSNATRAESEMEAGNQQIAPMLRFIDAGSCTASTTRICAADLIDNNNNGAIDEAGELCGIGQGCNVGHDSVAMFADATESNTCATLTHSKTVPISDYNGIPGLDDGTGTAVASTYVFQDWRDVLRIVYGGQHLHASLPGGACTDAVVAASPIAEKRCNSDVRLSVVEGWNTLFEESACNGADADACTRLRHAFRPDDASGTTEMFVSLLGLPAIANTPFCNGSEQQDEDPIRRDCMDDGRAGDAEGGILEGNEQVCNTVARSLLGTPYPAGSLNPGWRGGPTVNPAFNDDADLGLVQAIVVPTADAFTTESTTACTVGAVGGTFRYASMPSGAGGQAGPNRCPDGNSRVGGNCQWPARADGAGGFVFGCLAKRLNRPGARTIANMDGRVYNLISRDPDGAIQTVWRVDPSTSFDEAVQVHHAIYRIHATRVMPGGIAAVGLQGCQSADPTRQIACLVHASPCSVGVGGFAGSVEASTKVLEMASLALCATDALDNDGDGTVDEPGEPCAEVAANVSTIRRVNDPTGMPCAEGTGDNYGLRFAFSYKLWVNAIKGFETPSDALRDWDNISNARREKDVIRCACDRYYSDQSIIEAGLVTLDDIVCASPGMGGACNAPIRTCP